MNHKCPTHFVPLEDHITRYGVRWMCPITGCTVVCWGGGTSTPADQETRDLRHACHEAFDPLWRDRTKFKSRPKAYLWLGKVMGLPKEEAHIGMFSATQCKKLLAILLDISTSAS